MPDEVVYYWIGPPVLVVIVACVLVFVFKHLVKSVIDEAVKVSFAKHIEEYKLQLSCELEKQKFILKNSETIFNQQLEALNKLRTIFRHTLPQKRHPDMDWYEACEEIAGSFSAHAAELDEFICVYGTVLPSDSLGKLETAASLANDGTFQFYWDHKRDNVVATKEAIDTANAMFDAIREAVSSLESEVKAQIVTNDNEAKFDP